MKRDLYRCWQRHEIDETLREASGNELKDDNVERSAVINFHSSTSSEKFPTRRYNATDSTTLFYKQYFQKSS
jgi:hypothetical protein